MIFKYWKVIKLFFVIQIFIFIYVNLHEIQQQSETKLVVLKLNNSLTKFIDNANFKQYIRNKYFINKLLKENKTILVILIQVSSRLNYLKELISFLKNTRYINETLVIFSHDFINHQINNLIKNVTFCANLQIFYPYSLQIYSNKSFPGKDPNDCPKSIEKQKAILKKCNNAYYPDTFGNYRDYKLVQIKHHWTWKLSFTFEKLNLLKYLKDLKILLLEEDYYVQKDAIYTLRKLSEKISSHFEVVSLSVNLDKPKQYLSYLYSFSPNLYYDAFWDSQYHNTGLVLSRAQWNIIKSCSQLFRTYDGYNWDLSLQYLSQKCFKSELIAIYPIYPRVAHIGKCGTHHTNNDCNVEEKIKRLKFDFSRKIDQFFPTTFIREPKIDFNARLIQEPNGGWSDYRDHTLCKIFFDQ